MKPIFYPPKVLNSQEVKRIYNASLRLIAEIPLRADGTDEFNQALIDFGCRVDNQKIYFPKSVISKLLDRIESYKQEQAKLPEPDLPDQITPMVSGQGSLITDAPDDKLRPATSDDLATLARFIDALRDQDINVGWCHPTFIPADRPVRTAEIHAFAIIALNHSKPSRVSPYSPRALEYIVRIAEVAFGSMENVRENWSILWHKLWINTPFMISRETIEGAMLSRKLLGHKIGITIMPVVGAATPITAPAALALITAEVLAANVISLAIDDYLVGYCSAPLLIDVKTGGYVQQDPYVDLLKLAASQLGTYIFGLPYYPGGMFAPQTAAKTPSPQSMMEKTIGAFFGMIGGSRSFGCIGRLSYGDTASMVQLLLDLELIGYLNRVLKGLDCESEEKLAEDVILEIVPEGAKFMEHEHTAKYFREELWLPRFIDRRIASAWMKDPKTMLDNARQKALEIIKSAPNKSPLDHSKRKQIEEILAQADRELSD